MYRYITRTIIALSLVVIAGCAIGGPVSAHRPNEPFPGPMSFSGDFDKAPVAQFMPRTVFPPFLIDRGVTGSATAVFKVRADGFVEETKVESASEPAFGGSALGTVGRMVFAPATKNGKPVPVFGKVTFSFTFTASIHASDSAKAPPSIIGTWFGKDDKGSIGGFVFAADGTADVIKDGVSLKETIFKDQGSATYRFDPSVTPIALDIVLTRRDGLGRTLRGIVEFLSPAKMRVRLSKGDSRPSDFSGPENEMIVVEHIADENKSVTQGPAPQDLYGKPAQVSHYTDSEIDSLREKIGELRFPVPVGTIQRLLKSPIRPCVTGLIENMPNPNGGGKIKGNIAELWLNRDYLVKTATAEFYSDSRSLALEEWAIVLSAAKRDFSHPFYVPLDSNPPPVPRSITEVRKL